MQFEDEDELPAERMRQVVLYLFLPLIVAILLSCYLSSVPLYMVGCLLYKPIEWVGHAERLS